MGPSQKSVLGPQGGGSGSLGSMPPSFSKGLTGGGISKMPQVSGSNGFASKMPSIGGGAPAAGGPIQQLGSGNRDNDKMMMLPPSQPGMPSLGKPDGLQFQKGTPPAAAPKMHPNGNAANPDGFAHVVKAPAAAPASKMMLGDRIGNAGGSPWGGGQGQSLQMLKPDEADAMFAASRAQARPPVAGGGSAGGGARQSRQPPQAALAVAL